MTMLALVKLSLRITTTAFDSEIQQLIDSALLDLGIAGVVPGTTPDAIVTQAVITYVKAHFGQPADPERIMSSYREQKAQLQMATGYTEWGD